MLQANWAGGPPLEVTAQQQAPRMVHARPMAWSQGRSELQGASPHLFPRQLPKQSLLRRARAPAGSTRLSKTSPIHLALSLAKNKPIKQQSPRSSSGSISAGREAAPEPRLCWVSYNHCLLPPLWHNMERAIMDAHGAAPCSCQPWLCLTGLLLIQNHKISWVGKAL